MPIRLAVVVSQGQSQNPARRQLEEEIVAGLLGTPGIDVTVIPHLYDLAADGTGLLALQGIQSHLVVVSWLYPRAALWTLDRQGIHGQAGQTLLKSGDDDAAGDEPEDESNDDSASHAAADGKQRVADTRPKLHRRIYCLDLRGYPQPQPFLDEIKRIHQELNTQVVDLNAWIGGTPAAEALARYQSPRNDTALEPPARGNGHGHTAPPAGLPGRPELPAAGSLLAQPGQPSAAPQGHEPFAAVRVADEPGRRWYPVIDYSRCTNCMECIDFCLFGVYGVDRQDTILVEQPDNCRKGCPACSRVCPENAIIFPQHKSPDIAGAATVAGTLKIDLSQLFGGSSAVELAASERDEQLVLAGREAVGLAVGIPKRQADKPQGPKDALDRLVDQLDELDL